MSAKKKSEEAIARKTPVVSLARKLLNMAKSIWSLKEKINANQFLIRSLKTKVRDLARSRDKWKNDTLRAKAEVKALKAELAAVNDRESSFSFKQTLISSRE